MTSLPPRTRFALRVSACLAAFLLAFAPSTFAQATGTIAGRVFNPANGEYIRNAEVRISGTPLIGIGWRFRKFNANVSGIWSDESITGANGVPATSRFFTSAPEYLASRFVFDFGAGYKVTRHTSLFVSGRNVTNSGKTWYHKGDQRIRQMERYGAQWTLGVRGSY